MNNQQQQILKELKQIGMNKIKFHFDNLKKLRRLKKQLHNRNTQQRSTCETSKKYS